MKKEKRILTGDRPTGNLHLGHYVGSLENRLKLQKEYDTFLIIADVQALTTNFEKPESLSKDVRQVAEDYLAVGIDPEETTILVQSMIPEIAELTIYYSMFVTINQLQRNPTIKSESKQYGYQDMSYGFLGYPISQAADITFCNADLVPVGQDQLPHIEQTRKIVRRFNQLYEPVFKEPEPLISRVPRLVGLDGENKMSKSLDNAIYLNDSAEEVIKKVMTAKTDPARIRADDPGHPEVCTVFEYHQVFNENEVDEIEKSCKAGTIGCVNCKKRLGRALNELLEPIRERRQKYIKNPELIDQIIMAGTKKAKRVAKETMKSVREAMKLDYFNNK
ncbi:MAG: tryptophan--tRNA ligase [Halanaerobiales bacterium]|nr:tryptophan--tRNA ligase [Halanaerobiales bacterium]